MRLHHNPELFEQAVLRASNKMGIEAGIIEKDYYVTYVLKEIVSREPALLFKGGTSLSKCYKLLKRFSEDLDLTLEYETKPAEGQRKRLKGHIAGAIEALDLELVNPEEIRSRRDFNKYIIGFPSAFQTQNLKPQLQVETMIKIRSYPSKKMKAASILYDYLLEEGYEDLIAEYALEPFGLKVQAAERTFVDKVFALMDYYLSDKVAEHSRHIYDLYKLQNIVKINGDLKKLFEEVRTERKPHKQVCPSAQDGVKRNEVMREIITNGIYRADYAALTEVLLFEKVEYEEAIQALKSIVDSGLV